MTEAARPVFRRRGGKHHFAFVKELLFPREGGDIMFPAGDLDRELNEVPSSLTQLQVCFINFSVSSMIKPWWRPLMHGPLMHTPAAAHALVPVDSFVIRC